MHASYSKRHLKLPPSGRDLFVNKHAGALVLDRPRLGVLFIEELKFNTQSDSRRVFLSSSGCNQRKTRRESQGPAIIPPTLRKSTTLVAVKSSCLSGIMLGSQSYTVPRIRCGKYHRRVLI